MMHGRPSTRHTEIYADNSIATTKDIDKYLDRPFKNPHLKEKLEIYMMDSPSQQNKFETARAEAAPLSSDENMFSPYHLNRVTSARTIIEKEPLDYNINSAF